MKKYQHIIWDWNGTLIDDAWLCVEILNDILRQLPTIVLDSFTNVLTLPGIR